MSTFSKKNPFTAETLPNLQGKYAIVTGSSSGIGRAIAKQLYLHGCHVILTSRSQERVEATQKELEGEVEAERNAQQKNKPPVDASSPAVGMFISKQLDLCSFKSTNAFVDGYLATQKPLHILILNAGGTVPEFKLTEDGLESDFQGNVLGHVLMTLRLLPLLRQQSGSRVVSTSSMLHSSGYSKGLELDRLNDAHHWGSMKSYSMTKLANLLFTKELQKRLLQLNSTGGGGGDDKTSTTTDQQGKPTSVPFVNCFEPGYVASDFSKNQRRFQWTWWVSFFTPLFASSNETGALGGLYLSAHPEVEQLNIRGQYISGGSNVVKPGGYGNDDAQQLELWNFCLRQIEEKTGQKLTV